MGGRKGSGGIKREEEEEQGEGFHNEGNEMMKGRRRRRGEGGMWIFSKKNLIKRNERKILPS